jgi:dihydroorotate dehydrogenase
MLYKKLVRPLLFRFPAEFIHDLSLHVLSEPLCAKALAGGKQCHDAVQNPRLHRELLGLHFRNPIGIAAGLDKNAVAIRAWEHMGFGFAEIGTVTPMPQEGNPKPRIIRFPQHKGLVNRMGFPNDGLQAMAARLSKLKTEGKWLSIPIAINIGKGTSTELADAWQDYLACLQALHHLGDFFVVNVSSPNTPGLRELQQKNFLNSILAPLQRANRSRAAQNQTAPRPLLVKIAPDLTEPEIDEILESLLQNEIDGIIATNTLVDKSAFAIKEKGGLSGIPLRKKSTEIIRYIHRRTGGKLPIIGVGGIFTADDAREKLDAGASLLQIYTGFIYQGPRIVSQICRGLLE